MTQLELEHQQGTATEGKTMTATKMIARRTSKGYNAAESSILLADITRSHSGDNLAAALVYNEFATAAQAERFTK